MCVGCKFVGCQLKNVQHLELDRRDLLLILMFVIPGVQFGWNLRTTKNLHKDYEIIASRTIWKTNPHIEKKTLNQKLQITFSSFS